MSVFERLTVCLQKDSSIFCLGLFVFFCCCFFFLTGTYWLWTGNYDFSLDELQDSPLLFVTKSLTITLTIGWKSREQKNHNDPTPRE